VFIYTGKKGRFSSMLSEESVLHSILRCQRNITRRCACSVVCRSRPVAIQPSLFPLGLLKVTLEDKKNCLICTFHLDLAYPACKRFWISGKLRTRGIRGYS
jgi:hypothetical protein